MTITDPLTHGIIGCAMAVHTALGNGFQELIYQRALAIELEEKGISFVREMEMPIFYKQHEIGTRRADFLVERKVLVELKALIKLEDVHLAQGLNYLVAYNLDIGLLINFGATKRKIFGMCQHTQPSCSSFYPGYPDSDCLLRIEKGNINDSLQIHAN
jgi:GxxExxY protein